MNGSLHFNKILINYKNRVRGTKREKRKIPWPWFRILKTGKTQFRVFGGVWVQSSTFFDFLSFHAYFVFIGLYASLYKGDKETYKKS